MRKGKNLFLCILLFFLGFSSCVKSTDEKSKGTNQLGEKIVIQGTILAPYDFKSEEMQTGRIVTGRIITGRIITARAPYYAQYMQSSEKLSDTDKPGSRIIFEQSAESTTDMVAISYASVLIEETGTYVESDENGRFSIPVSVSSCPCTFTLSVGAVRKDGVSYRVRKDLKIDETDVRKGRKNIGDIAIYATGGIAGIVKLKETKNNMGVQVYIPGTSMVTITDENGSFIMGDVPIGNYKVAIEKVGYSSLITENIKVEPGKITYIGEFELEKREGKFFSGYVTNTFTAEPVAGAYIITDTGQSAITGKRGRFEIPIYGERRPNALRVEKEGFEVENIYLTILTGELRIALKPKGRVEPGIIKGRLYDWETTKPVVGATALLLPVGNITVTGSDGSFFFNDVEPGSYTIVFIKNDYSVGYEVLKVGRGQLVDLGILGITRDCNLAKFYFDGDGDGFGQKDNFVEDCYTPYGYVSNKNDCDDSDVSIHPGAVEICDGIDNNCDGQVDEGVKLVFYRDQDGDGYGNPSSSVQSCTASSGFVSNSIDCDDSNASISPSATEVCDGIDNNCNGIINDGILTYFYRDDDNDGQGSLFSPLLACSDQSGTIRKPNGDIVTGNYVSNSLDCNDANPNIKFGINETKCDGIDDNCNGIIDDGVLITFYQDGDADGFGNPNSTTQACSFPPGFTSDKSDCDDSNPDVNPSAVEIVDGRDENCSGLPDDLTFSLENISSSSPTLNIDINIDNTGVVHSSYVYRAYGNENIGYSQRTTRDGWSFVNSFYVLDSTHSFGNASIDSSPDGSTVFVSYYSGDQGFCGAQKLCFNYYSGGGWSFNNGLSITSYAQLSKVIYDYINSITHIIFYRAGSIAHIYSVGFTSSFSIPLTVADIPTGSVKDIDAVVSPDGNFIHIAYVRDIGTGTNSYPYYTRNATAGRFDFWLPPVQITSYEYNTNSVGIAISPDGATHICFTGENSPHLFYKKANQGGAFPGANESVDSEGPMFSCSIITDRNGNPHIAYFSRAMDEMRYAVKFAGDWKRYSVAKVQSPPPSYQKQTRILLDSRNIPHIGFVRFGFPGYATLKRSF